MKTFKSIRDCATAQEAYDVKREEVDYLIKKLQSKLLEHGQAQAKDTRNWGYAGDVADMAMCLRNAIGEEK